jgi:transposase
VWIGVDLGQGLGVDPAAGSAVRGEFAAVQWRKRRWRCRTAACPRGSFTEQVAQVPPGMRTTTRLRTALAVAVEDGRYQSEIAASHGVSWPTVQRATVAHGLVELVEPEPVGVWGMDETRFGRPRWRPDGVHPDARIRWVRTDPLETGFVDITGGQAQLGQVDGRTSAAVQAWLGARTPEFRAAVEVVVIDPHAGYAAAVRAALPQAQIAVDHFHLVMLANKAVTAVRQRVTRDLLGRTIDPAWTNRRLLLRGRERLSPPALARIDRPDERPHRGHQQADQAGERAACGFRNRENYRRRVRLHCTRRTRRMSAWNPTVPA